MVTEPTRPEAAAEAASLLARAGHADRRARARLQAAIDDIFLPADSRLDDRTRAAVTITFDALSEIVAGELREHAARLLRGRSENELAQELTGDRPAVADRLWQAGLPRDPDFMRELIGRVRLDLLAELLPAQAGDDPDRPSLLPRLTEHSDRVVAAAAQAVLAADNRRRAADHGGRTDLPSELHHKLVWWVAAALREPQAGHHDVAAIDRALTEAAQRNLAAHDEGQRLEAVSLRLAAALAPRGDELPELLVEALGDRRAALFAALIAQALVVPYEAVRDVLLDHGGERLWLACRALDLPRTTIAQIGVLLAEAEPRRDLERFADELDHVAMMPMETAQAAIAPLRLRTEYRAALDALRGER